MKKKYASFYISETEQQQMKTLAAAYNVTQSALLRLWIAAETANPRPTLTLSQSHTYSHQPQQWADLEGGE